MTGIAAPPPFFEDFRVGDSYGAPGVSMTSGHAAVYQAITGDRMVLPLDHAAAAAVTAEPAPIVHPLLVVNTAVGQSTHASQRVKANLFYRGLVSYRPVLLGDTLRTTTTVRALRQNASRPGRHATGLVVLEMDVRNQRDERVLHFFRCPMIPCRTSDAETGLTDEVSGFGADVDMQSALEAAPASWSQPEFIRAVTSPEVDTIQAADWIEAPARDTVTLAPELVRLTMNLAMAHTDEAESYLGQRLVYGGHVISLACAQVSRALPRMATILAWAHCDHTAPVVEGDLLATRFRITETAPCGDWTVALINAETSVDRGSNEDFPSGRALDWSFYALLG